MNHHQPHHQQVAGRGGHTRSHAGGVSAGDRAQDPVTRESALKGGPMRCALYARVSTDRQAEKDLSIPAQKRLMHEYATRQGWTIVEEFDEPGFTGTNSHRPALQEMLRRLQDRVLVVDIVLAHKINRLSRSWDDYVAIRKALRDCGVRLAYVVEPVDDTPAGRLMEGVLMSVGEYESINLGAEAKKGMRELVLRGGWPHRPPRGYVMVRQSGDTSSHVEVHPREGKIVASAFELFATGRVSDNTVAQHLAAQGLTSRSGTVLPHSYIRKLLSNPFYCGRIRWQGLDVQGRHQALVTAELFERVQAIVRDRHRQPLRHRTDVGFPLKGVAVCLRCRGNMTAERHGRFGYYRCSRKANNSAACDARFCRADRAHADIVRLLKTLQLSRKMTDVIARVADRIIQDRESSAADRQVDLTTQQGRLTTAAVKLTELFLAGSIAPGAFQQQSHAVQQERQRAHDSLRTATTDRAALSREVRDILSLSTSLYDLYEKFTGAQQGRLVRTVMEKAVLGGDGLVGFTLRPPFDALHGGSSPQGAAAAILDMSSVGPPS